MKIKAVKSYINVNMYLFILMLREIKKVKLIKLISPTKSMIVNIGRNVNQNNNHNMRYIFI